MNERVDIPYKVLEEKNPEREIDDTNGWYLEKDVEVWFHNEPCKHAVNKVPYRLGGYKATLPLVLTAVVQCYVGTTVCVRCLFESL